jgi:hypothetical protein
MAGENTAWQLEDFVDSLVVELDKTRETLAVKAINKPLSYTVKELALDLNIFPSYDGDQVRFLTAQPGQQGASKVTIQLGSITDQQVRATTKVPGSKGAIMLDDVGVDKATKKQLRKLGVQSVDDLQQIEQKNVDLKKVSDAGVDYKKLSNQIQKARRNQSPPRVESVSLSTAPDHGPHLLVKGRNLAINASFPPVAVINNQLADVLSADRGEVRIAIGPEHDFSIDTEVVLACDPFAVLKVNVHT